MQPDRRFQRFSATTLGFTIAVILWGAFVRATGSGAGCGSHWPTCNGQVIPRPETIETVIELTHRASSGIAFILVSIQLVWALRSFPKGSPVRTGAAWSFAFMVTEAAVGAGLVLFELVAHDASLARGASMSVHLVNTFLLLASMTLTVYWARGGGVPRLRGQGTLGTLVAVAVLASLVVGVSGAIAALGDTLFPASSLREGLAADLSTSSHLFLRLRALHPFLAGGLALLLLVVAGQVATARPSRAAQRAAWSLAALVLVQVSAGLVNLALLAPAWMQLVHLLLADALWIALVVFAAAALSAERAEPAAHVSATA